MGQEDKDDEEETPYSRPGENRPRMPTRRRTSVDIGYGNATNKRPASNGSALEALGALLLQRDSSGKVASLSFTRHDGSRKSSKTKSLEDGSRVKTSRPLLTASQAISSVSRAWLQGVKEAGAIRLGIQMPSSREEGGQTIAQRRARRQGAMAFEATMDDEENVDDEDDGKAGPTKFRVVGTSSNHPTFEVGIRRNPRRDKVALPDDLKPPDELSLADLAPAENETVSLTAGGPQRGSFAQKRKEKRTLLDQPIYATGSGSRNVFGPGSAFALEDPPDAPPSPIAMPGAWWGGSGSFWGSRYGEGNEEGALLLPPPLLDDQGSDARSFEGLLGVRRMREQERAKKQLEKLKARNRPAHKVGMLTAFGNFVKAAHAADKASKAAAKAGQGSKIHPNTPSIFESQRPEVLQRRHTEPFGFRHPPVSADDQQVQESDEEEEEEEEGEMDEAINGNVAPAEVDLPHQLDTVYEGEVGVSQQEQQHRGSPLAGRDRSRPPSRGSSLTQHQMYHADFPRAPRLVPIHTPGNLTSFTPMFLDGQNKSLDSDYVSSRTVPSRGPATPRIGPTLLSLPPSPWTPYQDLNESDFSSRQTPFLVMAPVHGPPGTPRLAPTYIEMNPSPFPTPSLWSRSPRFSSHLAPLTAAKDDEDTRALGVAGAASSASPPNQFSPLALSPMASPSLSAAQKVRKRKNAKRSAVQSVDSGHSTPIRLTPAQMIRSPSNERGGQLQLNGVVNKPGDASRATNGNAHSPSEITKEPAEKGEEQGQNGAEVKSESRKQQMPQQRRSFLLWFLLGDLGLGTRSTIAAKASGSPDPQSVKNKSALVQVTLSITAHTYGFFIFVLAHLVDLLYRIAENTSLVFWFLHWTFMNLTGQTVLSRCAIEAYRLVQNEWATVSMEDHEEKGTEVKRRKSLDWGARRRSSVEGITPGSAYATGRRKSLGDNSTASGDANDEVERRPKGLSRWQVMRGLFELYCLQDVTRQRYVAEGAGLEKVVGWSTRPMPVKTENPFSKASKSLPSEPGAHGRVDLGVKRSADRRAREESANLILAYNGGEPSSDKKISVEDEDVDDDEEDEEDDEQEEEEDDDDEESSDDEMVVTRQGLDVLEFTKTPKIEPRDRSMGSSSGGYFGSMSSSGKKKSRKGQGVDKSKSQVTNQEARQMIKTIKWASRLAISAYGLHVTLVDLPETFTPSGNRFSRQTFAHLSRLHHEDVLHADIQTLDSDAYSPTFYLVRDYSRKVVVVSVRGTQSLQDIIVDLEMIVTEVDLPPIEGFDSATSSLRCHAGILRAAKALIGRDSTLFATLSRALEENEGFGIVFTGHSLGGAIASTVVLLLSQYRQAADKDLDKGEWVTHSQSGLPADRPIRAITFAHPATVNAALAERSSLGETPLVLSVVLGGDIIPRCGHGQARELRRVLGALSRVRRRHEKAFLKLQQRARSYRKNASKAQNGAVDGQETEQDEVTTDARVHIVTSWWRWRKWSQKLASGQDLSAEELEKKARIETDLWKLRCDVEADLYAAVEARRQSAARGGGPKSPWLSAEREAAPLHQLTTRRQALDALTIQSEALQGGILVPAGKNYWLDCSAVESHLPLTTSTSSSSPATGSTTGKIEGGMKKDDQDDGPCAELYEVKSSLGFFSLPDLHTKMFAHHFPSAYETALLEDLRL